MLTENVSFFFHVAASVRFDDTLKYAILLNTRGTREAVFLAKEMQKLKMFVHLSTAYTNTHQKVIGEEMYPPQADWKTAIKIAEEQDEYTLNALTTKYIGGLPNTYVFTKQLSEHVVYDLCSGKLPAVILRPSIGNKDQSGINVTDIFIDLFLICLYVTEHCECYSKKR